MGAGVWGGARVWPRGREGRGWGGIIWKREGGRGGVRRNDNYSEKGTENEDVHYACVYVSACMYARAGLNIHTQHANTCMLYILR